MFGFFGGQHDAPRSPSNPNTNFTSNTAAAPPGFLVSVIGPPNSGRTSNEASFSFLSHTTDSPHGPPPSRQQHQHQQQQLQFQAPAAPTVPQQPLESSMSTDGTAAQQWSALTQFYANTIIPASTASMSIDTPQHPPPQRVQQSSNYSQPQQQRRETTDSCFFDMSPPRHSAPAPASTTTRAISAAPSSLHQSRASVGTPPPTDPLPISHSPSMTASSLHLTNQEKLLQRYYDTTGSGGATGRGASQFPFASFAEQQQSLNRPPSRQQQGQPRQYEIISQSSHLYAPSNASSAPPRVPLQSQQQQPTRMCTAVAPTGATATASGTTSDPLVSRATSSSPAPFSPPRGHSSNLPSSSAPGHPCFSAEPHATASALRESPPAPMPPYLSQQQQHQHHQQHQQQQAVPLPSYVPPPPSQQQQQQQQQQQLISPVSGLLSPLQQRSALQPPIHAVYLPAQPPSNLSGALPSQRHPSYPTAEVPSTLFSALHAGSAKPGTAHGYEGSHTANPPSGPRTSHASSTALHAFAARAPPPPALQPQQLANRTMSYRQPQACAQPPPPPPQQQLLPCPKPQGQTVYLQLIPQGSNSSGGGGGGQTNPSATSANVFCGVAPAVSGLPSSPSASWGGSANETSTASAHFNVSTDAAPAAGGPGDMRARYASLTSASNNSTNFVNYNVNRMEPLASPNPALPFSYGSVPHYLPPHILKQSATPPSLPSAAVTRQLPPAPMSMSELAHPPGITSPLSAATSSVAPQPLSSLSSCGIARRNRDKAVLFVGQLNYEATEADVSQVFSCYGRPLSVVVLKDKGKSARRSGGGGGGVHASAAAAAAAQRKVGGSAFVTYATTLEADTAIVALHGRYNAKDEDTDNDDEAKYLQVSYGQQTGLISNFGVRHAEKLHASKPENPIPFIVLEQRKRAAQAHRPS